MGLLGLLVQMGGDDCRTTTGQIPQQAHLAEPTTLMSDEPAPVTRHRRHVTAPEANSSSDDASALVVRFSDKV
jgi:hypothetical protein